MINIKDKMHKYYRIIVHSLFKSGNLSLGIDHFLVSFPSMLLMEKLLNDNKGEDNSLEVIIERKYVNIYTQINL